MNNQDIIIGRLSRLKIWITDNHLSDDQWSNTKKFILIKITTEDGIEGWGEAFSINLREKGIAIIIKELFSDCLLYTSPSPRDPVSSRMPSSA